MTRPLKVVGVRDVAGLRRRARRLLSLGRIYPEDAAYLTERLDQIEARIVAMHETNEYGEEA